MPATASMPQSAGEIEIEDVVNETQQMLEWFSDDQRADEEQIADWWGSPIERSINLVNVWKGIAEIASEASSLGRIEDYSVWGDKLTFPAIAYLVCIQTLESQLLDVECVVPRHDEFRAAVIEMRQVAEYFKLWPSSKQVRAARKRMAEDA